MIVAHRGGSSNAPENSADALEGAIAVGAEMVEFDVRKTGDRALAIYHDERIRRQLLSTLTLREVSNLAGYQLLTLADTLEITKGRIKLDIELKENGYVDEVLACLKAHGITGEEVVITSFCDEVVKQCRLAAPEIECGLLLGRSRPDHLVRTRYSELVTPVKRLRESGATFVAPELRLARLGVLRLASAAGYRAYVWTVNNERDIARLVTDSRVAAIITDVPAVAISVRARRHPSME